MFAKHSIFATAFLATTMLAVPIAAAQDQKSAQFSLPDLPYAVDALAPAINADTMELHHGKHHKAYVDNLNKAVASDQALQGLSLEQLVTSAGTYSSAVRNNAGGHWNHTFFWELMAPEADRGKPSEELNQAITTVFGSMDEFKKAFEKAGADQFGSGWAWLIVNEEDQLEITSTPNQDNPLMDVAETKGTPVLGNDVWEHAYYLTYNNRRPEYLSAWWGVVNWNKVSENYAEAISAE